MERHTNNDRDPTREARVEHEPMAGDPYIVLEDSRIANDPALPIIDLDQIEDSPLGWPEIERARRHAGRARFFGRDDLARRLEKYAEVGAEELTYEETIAAVRHLGQRGIALAREHGTEVDGGTAAVMALGIAEYNERTPSALRRFAHTGHGSYEQLRQEYLDVYVDPHVPADVKEWINWLGTHLIHRDARGREAVQEPLALLDTAKGFIQTLAHDRSLPALSTLVTEQTYEHGAVAAELDVLDADSDATSEERVWIAWLRGYLLGSTPGKEDHDGEG